MVCKIFAPIGATVHFIDEGIDTGPIVLKELNKLISKSKSIRNLRIESFRFFCIFTSQILKNPSKYPEITQDPEIGNTYPAYFKGSTEEAEKRLAPLLKFYPLHKNIKS